MSTKAYDARLTAEQILHKIDGSIIYNRQANLFNSYSRTGANMPKYRVNIASGESAVNAMNGSKYERRWREIKTLSVFVVPTSGVMKGKLVELSDSLPIFGGTYLNTYPSTSGASLTEANNRASAAIFSKIRNEMYQISGPTFLGELRESLLMIRRPAASLQKSLGSYMLKVEKNLKAIGRRPPSTRAVRDAFGNWQPLGKNMSRDAEVKKMLADTWLEYSFGWSPLVSDIKNGAIALARFGTDIRRSRCSAIGVHELVTLDLNEVKGSSPCGLYFKYSVRESSLIRVSYKVGLSASMNVPSNTPDRLIELCGFSWQNFIPTVWELMPWSFLVDYFANVNSVLEAYTTDVSSVKWASRTVYTGSLRKLTLQLDGAACLTNLAGLSPVLGRQDGGKFESEVSTVSRTSGLVYPTLTFKLPDTPRQVGNMAALFLAQGRMRTNSFL